jgi:hypothetical protein
VRLYNDQKIREPVQKIKAVAMMPLSVIIDKSRAQNDFSQEVSAGLNAHQSPAFQGFNPCWRYEFVVFLFLKR